jgi:uncharacterized protein
MELELRVREAPTDLGRLTGPLGRRVRVLREEISQRAARVGATNVRVFGSVARGEETETSDIDILVDLDEGTGLFALLRLRADLEQVLGAQVDLVPAGGLKAGVRQRILDDVVGL